MYDFEPNYLDLEIKTRHEADSAVGHEKRGMAPKQLRASVVKWTQSSRGNVNRIGLHCTMRIRMRASKGGNWRRKQHRSCDRGVKNSTKYYYLFVPCILQWAQRSTCSVVKTQRLAPRTLIGRYALSRLHCGKGTVHIFSRQEHLVQRHAALLVTNNCLCLISGRMSYIWGEALLVRSAKQ